MSHLDPAMPYASSRPLVFGRNAVAASQPLAAEAGLQMLRRGGNAVDAALAAAICLTVVEPTGTGIGSDLFAILWDGSELHGLNASGRAPAALTPERFAGLQEMPTFGWDPVTVPGAVAGWVELSRRFGRLPFVELFEPAVRYASEGFHVTPHTARGWEVSAGLHGERQEFARHFLPAGRAPRVGELFRSSDQANTLQAIADSTGEAFYRGDLAARMAAEAARDGGLLTEEDLASHTVDWVGTISANFGDAELHEIPPNGQGIAALMALGMLREFDLSSMDPDGPEATHLQIEAMKLAFADTRRFVSDPASMRVSVSDMLSADYLAERAKLISATEARDPKHGLPGERGTVYLTAADAEGRMVSLIQSNYMGFGSGVVIPGTGIAMQNRGNGFVLTPGHPNQVGGGKRPYHTIIPAFLMRNGAPLASYGVMGGDMQPQGHLQVALRLLVWGQNPQAASDAPRWRVDAGLRLNLESRVRGSTAEALRALGHDVVVTDNSVPFGGAQLIVRLEEGGYVAGSDHRKDGQAVSY